MDGNGDPSEEEIRAFFDEVSPAELAAQPASTALYTDVVAPVSGDEDFETFVALYSYLLTTEPGTFAVTHTDTVQRTFVPYPDETRAQWLQRITEEARRPGVQWLFAALLRTPDEPEEAVVAATGWTEEGRWYAASVETGHRQRRHGSFVVRKDVVAIAPADEADEPDPVLAALLPGDA